jgi:predicted cupin superfamily sugar epimerase
LGVPAKFVKHLIRLLKLRPHPREGGHFRESYRSDEAISSAALPARYRHAGKSPRKRSVSTAIYYLVTSGKGSPLHRLRSDEVYHFYIGDPVEVLLLGKKAETAVLGTELSKGERPQLVVPKGVWQGLRLKKGGSFALLGTTVAPGFDYSDYESADGQLLLSKYPKFKKLIAALL